MNSHAGIYITMGAHIYSYTIFKNGNEYLLCIDIHMNKTMHIQPKGFSSNAILINYQAM